MMEITILLHQGFAPLQQRATKQQECKDLVVNKTEVGDHSWFIDDLIPENAPLDLTNIFAS